MKIISEKCILYLDGFLMLRLEKPEYQKPGSPFAPKLYIIKYWDL